MALTKVADIVVPTVFNDYAMERSIYHSTLYKSGIIVADPQLRTNLAGGSNQFTTPFWKDLIDSSDDDEIPQEDVDVSTDKITTGEMTVRRQWRVKKWGATAMARVLAGADPVQAILDQVENYWYDKMQANLFSSIQGVVADNIANDDGDMVYDVTEIGDGKISSETIIDTNFLMGDKFNEITAIAMHSKPYATLVKNNLIDFKEDSIQNVGFGTYLGKSVILDDYHTSTTETINEVETTVYWNIMFKNGAFGYAESFEGYMPTEVDRNADRSGGETYLHSRRVFALHPAGFDWTEASVAKKFPTNAELATASNWDRVYSSVKNTGFVVCKTLG